MKENSIVGKSVARVDSLQKVKGADFCTDVKLPGMLHVKILRSPHAHAGILQIDTSKAKSLPGVRYVVTNEDAPRYKSGMLTYDKPVLAQDVVRWAGESVAAVAADSIDIAMEAIDLIKVEYEELPAVFDLEEASGKTPPVIIHPDLDKYHTILSPAARALDRPNVNYWWKIRRGNVDKGFAEADLVMENKFTTAPVRHAALEPHCTVVRPDGDDGVTIWGSRQNIFGLRTYMAAIFNIPLLKVRVVQPYVGGAFGGKDVNRDEAVAILLALKTKRPTKLVYTREETSQSLRSSLSIHIKQGVKKDGTLVARKMKVFGNCGAYDMGGSLISRACSHEAVDTYRIPNFAYDSYSVYTNTAPPATMRSVGCAEACWAIESQMDMLAEQLNIDPVTIRRKNILKEGEPNSVGEIVHSIGQEECLEKLIDLFKPDEKPESDGVWLKSKGIAIGNMFSVAPSVGGARVKVIADGGLEVYHGGDEIGQGCTTVIGQIAADEFGVPFDKVKVISNDTLNCPFLSLGSTSSRTTYIVGNAVVQACREAKRSLFGKAAGPLGVSDSDLDTKNGEVYVRAAPEKNIKISDLFQGYYGIPPGACGEYTEGGEIMGTATFVQPLWPVDPETGQLSPELAAEKKRLHAFYAYTAKGVEIAVNRETGQVKVLRCIAINDVGRPINPKMVEQQAEGGVVMGLGDALYEETILNNGVTLNPNFTDYKIPTFVNVPLCDNLVTDTANAPHRDGPYGAKGFAEGAMVGLEGAIAIAIYNATGVRMDSLPMTSERILKALKNKE